MDLYLYENILAAMSSNELLDAAQVVVEALGFQRFIYALRTFKSDGSADDFFFGTYPAAWQERYYEMSYQLIDPTVSHCFSKTTPIIWTHQIFKDARAEQLRNEAIQYGVSAGACFPVHNAHLKCIAIVGLTNDKDMDQAKPQCVDTLGRGQLFACYLNEAIHNLMRAEKLPCIDMGRFSSRELECLSWAAQGMSTKQIADKLNLSDDGVNFHFRNIVAKLKVGNRRQAVARAISFGLIRP